MYYCFQLQLQIFGDQLRPDYASFIIPLISKISMFFATPYIIDNRILRFNIETDWPNGPRLLV